METLNARFRIVTPMFISGADQTEAELRVPSIKGALRFWWRALAFSECEGNLEKLKLRERELFGSTAGQAGILMKLAHDTEPGHTKVGEVHAALKNLAGARYLGYGVMEAFDGKNSVAGRLTRPCLNEPFEFDLTCSIRTNLIADDIESLVRAIKLMGLLGGLGSKSRKGYGSLTLISLKRKDEEIWRPPGDVPSYAETLHTLLATASSIERTPPYSAFSTYSRVDWLIGDDRPLRVLDILGRAQQRYRSWGKNGKVNNQPSEKNFKKDHDWGKGINRPPGFHPKRVIFGLPHNYGKGANMQVGPASKEHDRRASPLFLHVQDVGEGRYAGIATLLRAEFLPVGEKINAGGDAVPQNADYSIITDWLEGGGPSRSPTPYFRDRKRLWP